MYMASVLFSDIVRPNAPKSSTKAAIISSTPRGNRDTMRSSSAPRVADARGNRYVHDLRPVLRHSETKCPKVFDEDRHYQLYYPAWQPRHDALVVSTHHHPRSTPRTFTCRFGAMRGSTIGEGGDTTISSPGKSPKQHLSGMRLHDPLHGRQACPKIIASDQGVGQICPPVEAIFIPFPPKTGVHMLHPRPPPNR